MRRPLPGVGKTSRQQKVILRIEKKERVKAGEGRSTVRFLRTKQINSSRRQRMNLLLWVIFGGIIGWIASLIMRTDAQQGILLNIVVGVVGAFLAGLLLTPFLGVGTINQDNFSFPSLLISLVGAVILLAVVNMLRGRSV
jgi:uncharacterized membrane protein YeaQ/YmgE (transglycosylase-associated protein family)